jgi:hypothetical protein
MLKSAKVAESLHQTARFATSTASASEEWGIFAEQLLKNRLQMGYFGATEEPVTLTKQMKIGPCEQVRVS